MICVPIMARDTAEALEKMLEAAPFADMVEIRLDVMEAFDLKEIINTAPKPLIVTYRSRKEGGQGAADYGTRIRYLISAIELGADFVDVEYSLPLEYRRELFQLKGKSGLIISTHLLNETPAGDSLELIFKKMAATGADIVKIITRAGTPEDNLRILGLISLAQRLSIKIIAFAMGPAGKISRVATHILGGYLTFASLEEGQESASGQIPIRDMKKMLDLFALNP